ncbi:MAG TPA: hypothetical protein VE934_08765 [Polaromonas sp.]|uniref:hypothetical protein n=1 Tax=Polaromonas sp. TaxID=1869339 RepID=UPI002D3EB3B1|nr:hypothetical protein [Polaromonas sp.]HYW57040.1 hypothetical protein [Polaromonas sp.]
MNTPSSRRPYDQFQSGVTSASPKGRAVPVSSPYDPQLLQSAEVLRSTLIRRRRHYNDPRLERFAREFFADDNMVWAYFFPREVGPSPHQQSFGSVAQLNMKAVWTPLHMVNAAANQAMSMVIVLPHEREFIHLATMVYPCALFHSVRAAVMGGYQRIAVSPDWLTHLRGLFLTDALRSLRREDAAMSDTLRAVLGLPGEGHIHPQQVSRLMSAVHLAHLQTRAVWATSGL